MKKICIDCLSKFVSHFSRVTLFLLVSTSTLFSQEIEWQNTIGGSVHDNVTTMDATNDFGYVFGGMSSSNISGDKSENCKGSTDFWIVKTDSIGNIQWQKTIGGSGSELLNSIKQTNDGGYILGGTSDSPISGDKTENAFQSADYWVLKLNSVGNIEWQNTIGGNGRDDLKVVEQTIDGGYILGGFSRSNISGDKTEDCHGQFEDDYWIIKIDSVGNIVWQNTIGGDNYDILSSIQQANDGGFFIGGSSNSTISGDKSENCIGGDDYWIVKTDSLGNIQWQNTIGGNDGDNLLCSQQTSDNGFILGGISVSNISGDKSSGSKGFYDFWIIKIDPLGNLQWQKTIGGNNFDNLKSIQQSIDGGYLLGGYSASDFSNDKSERTIGTYDFWIIMTDSLGNIEWENTIVGNEHDEFTCMLEIQSGSYIAAGSSNSNAFGDKSENSQGLFDYWIVKLTDQYNLITGQLFADLNSNSIQDLGEPYLTGSKITELNTGRISFSQQNGYYSMSVLDTGNFTVSPQLMNGFSPVPSTHTAIFTGINLTDSLNDFAFQPQGTFEDVCVTIIPLGNFRSGFNAYYQINYGNYGNTTVAPTVYFYPYNNVTFQSATLTPNQITPDSVVWNFPALAPFQTGSIIVTVNVNLGIPIGTLINSSAHIEPYLTDDNPSCNNSNWEVYTTGSFDPNDILVNRSDFTTTELSASPWLEYIIRFQNTGNDTAFTVKILNPIDTNRLNISSIEFVNASHPVNLSWINYQRNMEFEFENILLVDSNTNEPLSHGFVHYRIHPKTNLSAGDSITNFAAIYFDFNEPVITNTAKTIIVLPTDLASASPARGKLHVFPNPTEITLNISGIQLENGKAQLRLMDIYGKLIFEKTITSINTTLETYNLSSGIYLIQAGELRATFVKQ